MAVSSRFTRIPKVPELVLAGVPSEVIPTYCALADYSNNRTGVCWPKMETLARRLKRSPRSIQRHLHLLQNLGLIEFVRRLRDERGRFGAYVYRLAHIAEATARKGAEKGGPGWKNASKKHLSTGHGCLMASNKGLTKQKEVPPNPPKKDLKRGYWWFFGEKAPPGAEEEHQQEVKKKREEEGRHRSKSYEWFFN